MVFIRKSGNMFWQLLRKQKESVQSKIKEDLTDKGYWRPFRETYSKEGYYEEKVPIAILEVIAQNIISQDMREIQPASTDYQRLVILYKEDLKREISLV